MMRLGCVLRFAVARAHIRRGCRRIAALEACCRSHMACTIMASLCVTAAVALQCDDRHAPRLDLS